MLLNLLFFTTNVCLNPHNKMLPLLTCENSQRISGVIRTYLGRDTHVSRPRYVNNLYMIRMEVDI